MERDDKMQMMYIAGTTLEEVGKAFGLSRERVRQILSKRGVTRKEGGASLVAHSKRVEKAKKRAAIAYKKHPYFKKFRDHKRNAKFRGIDFRLSFQEWLHIWELSGVLEQRGTRKDQYVMSRHGDTGAYEIGNVSIKTASANTYEYIDRRYPVEFRRVRPIERKPRTLSSEQARKTVAARWRKHWDKKFLTALKVLW